MPNQQEVTLQTVAHDRLFVVPDYQRPYAWEAKQLRDLWEDLDLLGDGRHYAGTLVVRKKPGKTEVTKGGTSLTLWEVVDGQQRLTTTYLLIDRLRRRLAGLHHEGAAEIAGTLRSTYGVVTTISGVLRPKIQLGEDLNSYWQGTILGEDPAGGPSLVAGQQRLHEAAVFFDKKIAGLSDTSVDVTFSRLIDLMRRVTDGLRFLVYEVDSDAEVGVIFETLNERGRPLTELEKIKNYLLYLARQIPDERSDDLAKTINEKWAQTFQHLSTVPTIGEDRVLRAHWLATQDPDSRRWQRTQSVKNAFPRARYVTSSTHLKMSATNGSLDADPWDQMCQEVKAYADGLARCALFVAELHNPAATFVDFSGGHSRANATGAGLRRTRTTAIFYPLLFAARLRHPTDGDFYADIVELCETYAARVFVIVQRRANAGEPYLNRLAKEIFDGLAPEVAKSRLAALVWDYADDATMRASLALHENWYERRGHKYFLYEYERGLASSPAEIPDYSMFVDTGATRTTEHILPQQPSAGSGWWTTFSEEQHEQLRHTLGNLMLTYDNSFYSNKDYAQKRGTPSTPSAHKCYYNAQLRQEQEVAKEYDAWTPASIEQRQQLLANWALQRWTVSSPRAGNVRELEDDLGDEIAEDMPQDDHDPSTEGLAG